MREGVRENAGDCSGMAGRQKRRWAVLSVTRHTAPSATTGMLHVVMVSHHFHSRLLHLTDKLVEAMVSRRPPEASTFNEGEANLGESTTRGHVADCISRSTSSSEADSRRSLGGEFHHCFQRRPEISIRQGDRERLSAFRKDARDCMGLYCVNAGTENLVDDLTGFRAKDFDEELGSIRASLKTRMRAASRLFVDSIRQQQ